MSQQLNGKKYPITKAEALKFLRSGITYYHDKKQRLEFLTISRSHFDQTSILTYFDRFIEKMRSFSTPYYPLPYLLVCVDNQHIHCIWRKPFFMKLEEMASHWNLITGAESNLRNYNVRKDDESIQELVYYIVNQAIKHNLDEDLVFFYQHTGWGHKLEKIKYQHNDNKYATRFRTNLDEDIQVTPEEEKAWQEEREKLLKEYSKPKD